MIQKPNENALSENAIWDVEVLVFIEMLNALYRIPYKIWVARLFIVTRMADYYRCLPAVSHNLFACFDQSNNDYVKEYALQLLDTAYKLHQPLLFKDCLIQVAGYMPSDSGDAYYLSNKVIFDTMMKVRNEINRRVVEAQQRLMLSAPTEERSKLLGHCWEVGFEETGVPLSLPRYFRLLAEHDSEFANALSHLLQCELRLPCELIREAGAHDTNDTDHFYCARLLDRDLPVSIPLLVKKALHKFSTNLYNSSKSFSHLTDTCLLSGIRAKPTGRKSTFSISNECCLYEYLGSDI